MLTLIGLGIYDEGDISMKGIEAIKMSDEVFCELYTSPWQGDLKILEKVTRKKIELLERSDLEENSKKIIELAKEKDVAVLVSGDPLVATTHSALVIDAKKEGIDVRIIHASSIFSAIAECGLQIYKFGRTTTIAFPRENYFPESPYRVLRENLEKGLHTLFLLDVDFENRRYMTVKQAIELMLEMESRTGDGSFTEETACVGVARVGSPDRVIAYGTAKELKEAERVDFGASPHALVVPGKLHFSEEEYLGFLKIPKQNNK